MHFILRPWPHYSIFVWKRILFYALSLNVHPKTTENSDENRRLRKLFRKWSLLVTHRFENAPFLVWIGANGGFERRYQKKRQILSFPSGFSVVLLWTIGENVSWARTGEKTPEWSRWKTHYDYRVNFVFPNTRNDFTILSASWLQELWKLACRTSLSRTPRFLQLKSFPLSIYFFGLLLSAISNPRHLSYFSFPLSVWDSGLHP